MSKQKHTLTVLSMTHTKRDVAGSWNKKRFNVSIIVERKLWEVFKQEWSWATTGTKSNSLKIFTDLREYILTNVNFRSREEALGGSFDRIQVHVSCDSCKLDSLPTWGPLCIERDNSLPLSLTMWRRD